MQLFNILNDNGTGVLEGHFRSEMTFLEIKEYIGSDLRIDPQGMEVKFSLQKEFLGGCIIMLKTINNNAGKKTTATDHSKGVWFEYQFGAEWFTVYLSFPKGEATDTGTFYAQKGTN